MLWTRVGLLGPSSKAEPSGRSRLELQKQTGGGQRFLPSFQSRLNTTGSQSLSLVSICIHWTNKWSHTWSHTILPAVTLTGKGALWLPSSKLHPPGIPGAVLQKTGNSCGNYIGGSPFSVHNQCGARAQNSL